jgi:hypothetical protein
LPTRYSARLGAPFILEGFLLDCYAEKKVINVLGAKRLSPNKFVETEQFART